MSKRVVISSLGPKPIQGNPSRPHQQAVDDMMAFWRGQVDIVLPDQPDLIVVPEACDRYPNYELSHRLDYYRVRGEQMRDFFAGVARDNHCYVAYSAAREMPDGTWRNSTQILDRDGEVAGIYNKNHTVVEETTKAGVLCGRETPLIETDFGTIGCAICFDLNFRPLLGKYAALQPDLIVFCSMYHGGLMQRVWAYECRAHFVGAIAGCECTIIDPLGELLARSTNYYHWITHEVNLDCVLAHLDYNNAKFRALKQRYGRGVTITDPGYLGCVKITSELDGLSVQDMVAEFDIELLDAYWERALAHRDAHLEP